MATAVMKPTALLLNLFVLLVSIVQFLRGKHFLLKIFLPFALAPVPMAFVGGMITVDAVLYNKILGMLLVVPVIRFLFFANTPVHEIKKKTLPLSIVMGASIGFLSGLTGIGGCIILLPILLFFKWTDKKETAAISALFIFVNSAAGCRANYKGH